MAIKIEKQVSTNGIEISFPKLMQDQEGKIYYMVKEDYGLPLTDDGSWDFEETNFADFLGIPYYAFTDYNEPITIQNKQ